MKWNQVLSSRVLFQDSALAALKKEYMFMDTHCHTHASHDSNTKIKDLVKRAEKLGIGFAVTDHVQAKGAIEACKQKKVPVIPGIEVLSQEKKEVIIYFYSTKDLLDYYNKHIKNFKIVDHAPVNIIRRSLISVRCMRPMEILVERADDYACVKTIPHPYAYFSRASHEMFEDNKAMMRRIDGIEVINSSLRPRMNLKATAWALKMKKAFTAGSDAHFAQELGHSYVGAKADTVEQFLDAIKRKEGIIIGGEVRRREALRGILKMNKIKRTKDW
jgi:predicted metal-dependent phosphoesterase TrpH